ncbi:MAG TPA: hypothetical protein VKR54_01605 [Candidatus Babeliales bacterium]|nr:hypothetical protein [Candidatus Babeliales bacterium]
MMRTLFSVRGDASPVRGEPVEPYEHFFLISSFPSTGSGRTGLEQSRIELSAAFIAESIEASGQATRDKLS